MVAATARGGRDPRWVGGDVDTAHLDSEVQAVESMLRDRLPLAYRPLTVRAIPVQSAAMSADDRSRRAEARRRARLAARGAPLGSDETEPEAEPRPRRQGSGFLGRLFPSAPPLPGRPDPLAGFSGDGPLRPVAVRAFLLRSNPLAWLLPAVVAFAGLMASLTNPGNPLGLIGTFALFGALIAAGWFGWQRPTLYGTAAALLAFFAALAVIFAFFSTRGASPTAVFEPTQIILSSTVQALFYGSLGFIGGWYGGYLRRRQTQLSGEGRGARRRR
jgi:hypothetical protein